MSKRQVSNWSPRSLALLIPTLAAGLGASLAFGAEQSYLFDSARQLGRGRTGVAAFDSDEGSRINPASLADPKLSFQLRPLQLDTFVSKNSMATLGDLTGMGSSENGLGFLQKFDDKFGERQYVKGQLSPVSMRFGAFEISPLVMNTSHLELGRDESVVMDWKSDSLAGASFTYAFALGKTLNVGITFRPLYRWYLAGRIGFTELMEFLPPAKAKFEDYTPLYSGLTLGSDLGFLWKPAADFRLGLVIKNVGDASVTNEFDKKPPALLQEISLGMLSRSKWGSFNFDYYLDAHDLNNRQGLNLLRLFSTGVELGRSLFSRDHDIGVVAGINEGYVAAGLFVDLYALRLDFASYGVELGHGPSQKGDQRWALSARSSMTF